MKTPPNHHIPPLMLDLDSELLAAARRYAMPLFFYSAEQMAADWASVRGALPGAVEVYYSVKANPSVAVVEAMAGLGAGFEISSLGELKTLHKAGAGLSRCLFAGPGKSEEELRSAIRSGVGLLAVESTHELSVLEQLAEGEGISCDALLRINPGVGYGDLKMTGTTQFGMDPASAIELLRCRRPGSRVRVAGIHGFMGTRLLVWNRVAANFESVLSVAGAVSEATGLKFSTIGLGGGLGVPLYEGDGEVDLETLGEVVGDQIAGYRRKHPEAARFIVELGRSLVARCGVLLTTVVDVKETAGMTFVIVDGGISVLGGRDVLLGGKNVPVRVLSDRLGGETTVTVCGPLCTPADRLAVKVRMPRPEPGDVLALYIAGGYCLTASPGLFLSRGFPGEVMMRNGVMKMIRAPIGPEEILAGQRCWSEDEVPGRGERPQGAG